MRKHLFIFILLSACYSYGQTEVLNNAANSTESSEELKEEQILDSMALEPVYDMEMEEKTKSRDNRSLKKAEQSPKGVKYDKDADQPGSYRSESMAGGFTYSKTQSTYQRTQRTPSVDQQKQMDDAVGYFESYAPNSFEHHYFKYVAGNYNTDLIEHLLKAEELRPNNSDVHKELAAYYIITNQNSKAKPYFEKLKNAKRLTNPVITYGKDILLSVPNNGVLITHGFDDTYAVWYDQQVNGVRKDVTLVSLDFMQSETYRANLKKDGFKIPQREVVDVSFLKQFCSMNKSKKLAISLTTPKEYFSPIQSLLFVTGLVFEYHQNDFSNFSRNEDLWNNLLNKTLVNNAVDSKSKQLSANYLPMLFQLRAVYLEQGEDEKMKEIDEWIDKIGIQCNKYNQVQKIKNAY